MSSSETNVRDVLCRLCISVNATFTPFSLKEQEGILPKMLDWWTFSLSFSSTVLIFLAVYLIANRFHDKESRTFALFGCYGSVIGSFAICIWSLCFMYGNVIATEACSLFIIPAMFAFETFRSSRVHAQGTSYPIQLIGSILVFFSAPSIPLILIYLFPQSQFTECNQSSLFQMLLPIFLFADYSVLFFLSNYHLWKMIFAEKLMIVENSVRPIGYLVEKNGFWVRIELSADNKAHGTLIAH